MATARPDDHASHPPGGSGAAGYGVPLLEFDQLLSQLVARAQELMGTQSRLRALLAANTAIIGNLALPVALRRIVEVACELVDARYGALGVVAPVGGLEEFIHVGMDGDAVERIGHLPTGKGLLGALIDDPRPIRLESIGADPRSIGFPANHPPMASFLGVPVRVRDEVFGNLYLAEAVAGRFSEDDERIVAALAATAGVVIENARLFEQAKRRQEWLQASGQIQQRLMAPDGPGDPLELIAQRARSLAEADLVSLVLPAADGTSLRVAVAAGAHAAELVGFEYPREGSMVELALHSGQPVLSADTAREGRYTHQARVIDVGPLMVVPLIGGEKTRGALSVARRRGRRRFDESDLDMAMTFAGQAAVSLELSDARADRERVLLLEDRDRIARDLHDHVIQRLFAAGMTLQGMALLGETERAARVDRVVTDIDDVIAQIRNSIFGLRGSAVSGKPLSIRAQILNLAAEAVPLLGFEPRVRFIGPVDTTVGPDLADDLVAVAREALSNAARHSHADAVEMSLAVTADALVLDVVDNGVGLGQVSRRSGLDNMRVRAEQYGGTLTTTAAPVGSAASAGEGTHLQWTIPL